MKLIVSGTEALTKVPSNLYQCLKGSWVKILKSMVFRIQEGNPISYKIVRVVCALDAVKMAASDPDNAPNMFDSTVVIMYRHKQIIFTQEEVAKEQFRDFLSRLFW